MYVHACVFECETAQKNITIHAVRKYTTIIKLTNLEEHAREHNTQRTPIFATVYVTTTKMQFTL